MKKYISIKHVQAEPMDELQAVGLGYARPNEDNHEWREGYHVLYPDGYHSWCPKQQFEQSNQIAETPLDRMKIELKEAVSRKEKLDEFILSENFGFLGEAQQALMLSQLDVMFAYINILNRRLSLIEKGIAERNIKPCDKPCCEETTSK